MLLWWLIFVVFFKQKTAYEMRISDWSSDVCSSDLATRYWLGGRAGTAIREKELVAGTITRGRGARRSPCQCRRGASLPPGSGRLCHPRQREWCGCQCRWRASGYIGGSTCRRGPLYDIL